MTPSDERVGRLPKWARAYIEGLERRIDGDVDIGAGGVNYVTLTRAERRDQDRHLQYRQYTISAAEWRRLIRSKP